MYDIEQLGVFYLGKKYDLAKKQRSDVPVLYDAKHLVTHALCVGMTGSGKTGLCISLLEEAAIDGVPAIVIDPKGDLGNLALAFPSLRAEDFAPWVDEQEAARRSLTVEAFAEQTAATWAQVLGRGDVAERPEPGVWSALEYACHVRDVHVLFAERVRLMLDEDGPTFANWDQDATAVESDYAGQDAATVAVELIEAAGTVAGTYATVTEVTRHRPGVRSNGDRFTVETLGSYHLHDVVHHLHDVGAG